MTLTSIAAITGVLGLVLFPARPASTASTDATHPSARLHTPATPTPVAARVEGRSVDTPPHLPRLNDMPAVTRYLEPMHIAPPVSSIGADNSRSATADDGPLRDLGDNTMGPREPDVMHAPPPKEPEVKHAPPLPEGIEGVRAIELTADELARIGIRVDSVGVWTTWQSPGEEQFAMAITPGGIQTHSEDEDIRGVEVPSVAPTRVTDDLGMTRITVSTEDSVNQALRKLLSAATANGSDSLGKAILERIHARSEQQEHALVESMKAGRMVAILVHVTPRVRPTAKSWRPDCIFWYEPTSELLERLPARVRLRLQSEMQYVDALAQGRNGSDTMSMAPVLNNTIAGERPYIDVIRSAAGALTETAVAPNPAQGRTVVSYRLAQPRSVEISLHDMSGRRLRQLVPLAEHPAGRVDAMVDLLGVAPGTYLIAISTPGGERAVQRLIVLK